MLYRVLYEREAFASSKNTTFLDELSYTDLWFEKTPITLLWMRLSSVPDPRRAQGRRHDLSLLLTLALLASCCSWNSYQAMHEWCVEFQNQIKTHLPFLAGHTPDASTFHRVFSNLDYEAFEEVIYAWFAEVSPLEAGEGIALDGKTIGSSGLHIVASFAHKAKRVLWQRGTDTKGKELVIGPEVLSRIPLMDHIVTGDAMFTQVKICKQITESGGGYVFTVKGNQEKLEEDIRIFFESPPWGVLIEINTTVTRARGRIETRTIEMSQGLNSYLEFPGVTHIWRITRTVKHKGEISQEVSVGIARLLESFNTASYLNRYIRQHWSIENNLHRARDTLFAEDQCPIRKRNGPYVATTIRNLVIALFHKGHIQNHKQAMRRFTVHPEQLFVFLGLQFIQQNSKFMYN